MKIYVKVWDAHESSLWRPTKNVYLRKNIFQQTFKVTLWNRNCYLIVLSGCDKSVYPTEPPYFQI